MISNELIKDMGNSSWIRRMFEEGVKLKQQFGAENVYDFSLGNPELPPPTSVTDSLKRIVNSEDVDVHRYMNNAGFTDVRKKVADSINKTTEVPLSTEHIIMTCGAAGGLNVCMKTLLNPGEEIIIFAPFFAEYRFYISNFGGKAVIIPTNKETFQPDLKELEKNITSKTKAIIINSPNNPTGVVYSECILRKMADLIETKEKEFNTSIFVLSDEPYAKITYDNVAPPNMLNIFKNSIIVNSFSKSLGIPGERIGYIAVNSKIENLDLLINGLVFCNRTLGYVNAPALFQKIIANSLEDCIDMTAYTKRRDLFYTSLTNMGFSCVKPEGAFYLFPKSLIEDDVEFVLKAKDYNLLLVPGSGFGWKGNFRVSYCVSMETIENSLPAFEKLAAYYKK